MFKGNLGNLPPLSTFRCRFWASLVHFQRSSWNPRRAVHHPLHVQWSHLFSTSINNSKVARMKCSVRFLHVGPASSLLQNYSFILLPFSSLSTLPHILCFTCFPSFFYLCVVSTSIVLTNTLLPCYSACQVMVSFHFTWPLSSRPMKRTEPPRTVLMCTSTFLLQSVEVAVNR